MKHPTLKNYFSVRCVQTIGELWGLFHKDKSVFVRSWNRVHPCKFFLNNDLHFTIKRLEEMIENREFMKVIKKNEYFGKMENVFSKTCQRHQFNMRLVYKDIAKQIPQSIDWVCNWFESGRTLYELSLMYKLEL